jgi:uncharacterized protein involved in exopolysaccharide biosynthesis
LDRALSMAARTRRFVVPTLIFLVVGALVSVGYAMVRPRVYKSETLILYREGIRSTDIVGGEEQGDRAHKLGLRLKEMVLSRTRLERIIKEAKLYPALVEERGVIDAVDEMRKHIAFRVQDGDTFGLSFEADEPKRVQLVTSKLADALILENSRTNSEQAEVTKDFLDRERERTEKELKEKEMSLAQFLAKHPEFARETATAGASQAGSAVRAQQSRQAAAPKVDGNLASLEREATRLQERLGLPVKHKREAEIDPVLLSAKQEAESDVRAAQKDLAEKQSEFTEEHPDVRAARVRLKLTQEKLRRANDAINSSLSTQQQRLAAKDEDEGSIDRGALENQLRRINDEIVEYKRRRQNTDSAPTTMVTTSVVALETDWTRLNREVVDARERFQSLQDKQFKATMVESAAATGNTAQMEVIDPAFVPTHAAKPGRTTIVGAGVAIAALLSIMLALGLAMLDDRLYDRIDVERLAVLPLLSVVPRALDKNGQKSKTTKMVKSG